MREGWVDYKFKDVATAVKGKLPKNKNEVGIGIPYLTASYLRSSKPDFWIENLEGAVTAEDGDCLILWDGAGAGDLFSAHRGVVSSTMAVVTTQNSKILREFLTLFISSKADYIKETCRGTTVPHVSPDAIANMALKIPPLPEQKRIVDFISSVDSYIKTLQQQLESAKKSRNAVLHELLTAGGDDWLRAELSEICTMIKRGQAPSYTGQRSVTVLNQKCVRNGRIHFEFARQTDSNIKPIKEWAYLTADDTLVNSTGVGTLGRVAFVGTHDEPLTVDSHLTIVRPDKKKIEPSFLGLSLHFREADIEGLAAGSSGQTELSREALGSLIITIPPLPEQKRIVEIIASLDKVANQTQLSITESQNLRSGLLSDLLSGEHEIPTSYDKVMGAAS